MCQTTNKMTVKIDRFQIETYEEYIAKGNVDIIDYLKHKTIVEFMTGDEDLNVKLAKIVLNELNKEFLE